VEFNGTIQTVVCGDDVNLLGDKHHNDNPKQLFKDDDLEVKG
jgi:hypothetical protein